MSKSTKPPVLMLTTKPKVHGELMNEILPSNPPDDNAKELSSGRDGAKVDSKRLLFNPPIDIYETPDGLVLYADLPGVTAEDLELQVQDNRLTLLGRVLRREPDDAVMLHQEYAVGDFLRSFILSDQVDHDRIQARLTNGVLRVELPKAQRAKPRRIEVSQD